MEKPARERKLWDLVLRSLAWLAVLLLVGFTCLWLLASFHFVPRGALFAILLIPIVIYFLALVMFLFGFIHYSLYYCFFLYALGFCLGRAGDTIPVI